MKRSVDNQLITQMFCGMLFSYIFFQPLFAWRIIIGPITPWLSVFASIVDNIFKNWMGVCFTQMVIFKVSQSFYEVVCIQMILLPQIDILRIWHTGSSCLMRISLLRFFKTITKIWLMRFYGLFILLLRT